MAAKRVLPLYLFLALCMFPFACSTGSTGSGVDGDVDWTDTDHEWPQGEVDSPDGDEPDTDGDAPKPDGDTEESDSLDGDMEETLDGDVDEPDGDADKPTDGDVDGDTEESDVEGEDEGTDLCFPDPCNGHGVCDPSDGSCDCTPPYAGAFCEECAPHYTGYPDCIWDGVFPAGYCAHRQCWPVTPTGQTICYDGEVAPITPCPGGIPATCGDSPPLSFCGQDAQYPDRERSLTEREVSGDTVVDDSLTGLIWARDYLTETTWQAAQAYCDSLDYAGFTDWRLPNPHELASLVHYATYLPASAFPGMPNSFFWSAQLHDEQQVWSVWFYYGMVSLADKDEARCDARCVRQEASSRASSDFAPWVVSEPVAGESVVGDVVTGLAWQKGYATGKTWRQALAYCEGLSYGGHDDWRLPNVNELRSLVVYDGRTPTSDFPDMPSALFWTSSTRIGSTYNVWGVRFDSGLVHEDTKINACHVRCVRGGP